MDLMKRVGLDREESVSLIAENCHVQGELRFSAELIINGRVSGVVTADTSGSGLNVGTKGEVVGNLYAPSIIISGQVKGDIYAFGHIELTNTARVSGNLFYQSLQMATGRKGRWLEICTRHQSLSADRLRATYMRLVTLS